MNYRTNILGDLLNVEGVWNITIDEKFENNGDRIYDSVSSALQEGGAVTLTEDYSASKSSGVVIKMNKVSSLDLNGYTFKNEKGTALDVRGSLTINGNGKVLCGGPVGEAHAAVFVQDSGKVVINDGYYYSKNGNSCIYVQAGNKTGHTITIGGEVKPLYYGGGIVEINGGVFEADANNFVLNQNDYIENESCFSVKGGIFVGFNPADVNECHGKVTSFVAEGYRSVKTEYEGKEAWKVEEIPAVTTQEDFATAFESATSGSTIVLASGTYTIPKAKALSNVLFVGGENTIIDLTAKDGNPTGADAAYNNVTFKNIQFKTWTADYHGFQHCGVVNFENCTFSGKHFGYGVETYKHCTFNQSSVDYSIWTYSSTAVFEDCEFNCLGKAALVYREGNDATKGKVIKVVFNNCKFRASALAKGKAAIEIDSSLAPYEVYINKCTAEGFDNGSKSGNSLWNNKKGDSANLKVVVDGVPQTLN